MKTHLSSFSRTRGSLIHQESMGQAVLPKVNMLSQMTGGLKLLYKQINGGTAVVKTYKYTNRKGHFIAELNYMLGGRYIIISHIETRGETAVLLKAKDCFHQFRPVVIKVVHLMYRFAGLQEVQTLRRLKTADPCHLSHTMQLLNAFIFNEHVCLVFPALDVQPLTKVIAEKSLNEKNTWSAIRKISRHLLTALAFLRTQNIIHADVKPENILVDEERDLDSVTLIDFGNAMNNSQSEISMYYEDFELQTLPYRAPEVFYSSPFGMEIDMWSLGCVLYECYAGRVLFSGANKTDILQQIITLLGPVPTHLYTQGRCAENLQSDTVSSGQQKCVALRMMSVNPSLSNYQFASFLSGLLSYDPDHRMTPWEALQHPFMAAEICIPYFLNTFSPETNLTLKRSDYQHKQKISKNILRMYPSTFDLLRVGTSDPALTKSPSTNQVKPSTTSALLNVEEKYLCASGENSRHSPVTSTDRCKQAPSDKRKQVPVPADKCKQAPADKCKQPLTEKSQHDRRESSGSQTLPDIKTLAVKVGIAREKSEMMSLSEYSNSLHSFDESGAETSSKNSYNQTGHVEDYPAHVDSVNPRHIVSACPCTQGDLLVHNKTNDERTDLQHVFIKTEISSLHEDAEFRYSVEEKVTSWLQDQTDVGDDQSHSSGNALKNSNTHFIADDQNSVSNVSDHASNITGPSAASSIMEMCPETHSNRGKSHDLNAMLSAGSGRTYYSKTNVHRQVKPKTIFHTRTKKAGQETSEVRHEKMPDICPQRKRQFENFEDSKEYWKSPRNATRTVFSNSACPISREKSNPHLICQGENSKISSSSFKKENVYKEKFKNSQLNSTFTVDEHSCFKPIHFHFNPLFVKKAGKEKYVNEMSETFTKEEPQIQEHCGTRQVTSLVQDESRILQSMTVPPSHSGLSIDPLTNLQCSIFKQDESNSHETFVKCESTSSSCASSKSQEHFTIDRQDISGYCQCKESSLINRSHNMFSCTFSERKHTTSTVRKNDKNFTDCISDETSTAALVNNKQPKVAQSPGPRVICEVHVTNNRKTVKIPTNKIYDNEIAQGNTSCIDEACMREKNSSPESCGACHSWSHSHFDGKQMGSNLNTLNRSMGTNVHDTTLITINSEASGPVARHTAAGFKPLQVMTLRHHDISLRAAHSSASTSSHDEPEEVKNVTARTKVSPQKVQTNSHSLSKIADFPPKTCLPPAFTGNRLEPVSVGQTITHPVHQTEKGVRNQSFRTRALLTIVEKDSSRSVIKCQIDANPGKHRSHCGAQNQHSRKLVRRALWSTKKLPKTSTAFCADDRGDLSFSHRDIPSIKVGKRLLQGLSPMSVNDTDPYEFKDSTLKSGQNQRSPKAKSRNLRNTKKRRHKKRALTNRNHAQIVMSHELDLKTLVARKSEQLRLGINSAGGDKIKLANFGKDKSCTNSTFPQQQLPLKSNRSVQVCDSDRYHHYGVADHSRILCHKDRGSFSHSKEKQRNSLSKCHQLTKSQGEFKEKNGTSGQKSQDLNSCPLQYEVQKPSPNVSKMKTSKQKRHRRKNNASVFQKQSHLGCSSASKTVSLNPCYSESRETSMIRHSWNADLNYNSIKNTRKICTNDITVTKNNNCLGSFTCDKENSDVDEDVILVT